MPSIFQIKRRLTGAAGAPPEAGAREGEIAINAGAAGTPEVWAFFGNSTTGIAPANRGWLRLNPAPALTVTSKSIAGTTNPWTDGNNAATSAGNWPWVVTSDQVPIVQHDGSAYMFTGGAGSWGTTSGGTALTAAMFVSLGQSISSPQHVDFDANAQVQAGSPATIGQAYTLYAAPPGNGRLTGTPTLVTWGRQVWLLTDPANPNLAASYSAFSDDVDTQVIDLTGLAGVQIGTDFATWDAVAGQDITGSIVIARWGIPPRYYALTNRGSPNANTSWTAITEALPPVLTYRGNITGLGSDYNTLSPKPGVGWTAGDFGTASADVVVGANWPGLTMGTNIPAGSLMIWDGTNFDLIPHTVDLSAYLPLAGTAVGRTMTSAAVVTFAVPGGAAPAAPTVRIDGGDPSKSALDNFTLDAGVF